MFKGFFIEPSDQYIHDLSAFMNLDFASPYRLICVHKQIFLEYLFQKNDAIWQLS